jgi:putative redox protein
MPNEMKVELHQVSASTSKAIVRDHSVFIDRPLAKGGVDLGPMGGELFLVSVGGCFMSNLLAAIRARDARISDVRTEVAATLADSPSRFVRIELLVTGSGADMAMLDKLVEIADRGCIMMNTLRGTLDLTVRIGVPVSHTNAQ